MTLLLLACNGPAEDVHVDPIDTVDSVDTASEPRDPRFDPLAEALLADLADSTASGVSVAVWQDGEVVYAEGFGSARSDSQLPVKTTTLFQIGSTTKFQTAIGLLQQVEDGLLSLDDSLADTAPLVDFALGPEWNEQIALQHLISHQGGFYDWLDWSAGSNDGLLQGTSYGTFSEYLWLMSPPGSFWNYSNPNFVMAGLVSELQDGRAWPDLMVDKVYQPLGMDRTFLRRSQVAADGDYALGTGFVDLQTGAQGDISSLDQIPDPAWARPAGLAWSTPTQMMALAEFLVDGDPSVLSDELREQMTSPQVALELAPPGVSLDYGYGLMLTDGLRIGDDYLRTPVWNHGGNTLHFTSIFYVLPEERFAISILSSGYGTRFEGSLVTALDTLVELPEAEPYPDFEFDADALDAHVGHYVDANNVGDIFVSREGDGLTVSMPLLDELGYAVTPKLEPASSDIWYVSINGTWYDLTFLGQEEGQTLFVRNRAFVGTRTANQAIAASPSHAVTLGVPLISSPPPMLALPAR